MAKASEEQRKAIAQQAMAAVKGRRTKKERTFDNEKLGAEGTQLQETAQTAVFDG